MFVSKNTLMRDKQTSKLVGLCGALYPSGVKTWKMNFDIFVLVLQHTSGTDLAMLLVDTLEKSSSVPEDKMFGEYYFKYNLELQYPHPHWTLNAERKFSAQQNRIC